MIPRLLEYEDGMVKVTAEAYCIPEIKAILDKYDMEAEPYLAYINGMSSPVSPYINIPIEERKESIIFDVNQVFQEFDYEDPLVEKAIERIRSFYTSTVVLVAEELGEEIHRFRLEMKNVPLKSGEGGNFKERVSLAEKIEKILSTYGKAREAADKEITAKMKGSAQLGEY